MIDLHRFFFDQSAAGANKYGLLCAENKNDLLDQFAIVHPFSIDKLIVDSRIQRHLSREGTTSEVLTASLKDLNPIKALALRRNRQVEKMSPNMAMQRFKNSKREDGDLLRMKQKINDYILEPSLHLPIGSSKGHDFSLHLKINQCDMSLTQLQSQDFIFNRYGLSTADTATFLPSLEYFVL